MITILTGDAIEQLRTLPDESVQCCVTSPPYWGLRDYGTAAWEGGDVECDHKESTARHDGGRENVNGFHGSARAGSDKGAMNYKYTCGKCGARRIDSQLGLERTPEEYVAKMVAVFRELRRVLRKDGTLWLNLGDSYSPVNRGENARPRAETLNGIQIGNPHSDIRTRRDSIIGVAAMGIKPKDLCGIPWRVAFALQADGWWLRSDIIWAKPNPMPESVTDRPTKAHEYLFLLTKSASYFYDAEAIKERAETVEDRPFGVIRDREWGYDSKEAELRGRKPHPKYSGSAGTSWNGHSGNMKSDGTPICNGSRNKRSVWTVATAPYPEAHFATYPPDLVKPCIMAGTSAKGCCAKCGAPWERIVETNNPSKYSADDDIRGFNNDGRTANPQSSKSLHRNGTGVYSTAQTLGWKPTCECTLGDGHLMQPCTVLDPFAGSGTTGAVALELGRKAILIELNPKYVELIRQRCDITPGLALA